ncbi:MAG: MFS transporter, partial [Mycetocola sp.]
VTLSGDLDDEAEVAVATEVEDLAHDLDAPKVLVGGNVLVSETFATASESDLLRGEAIALPIAIVAILLLQSTLHLPKHPKRRVRIDYLGAILITGGVSLLLIWVSMAGTQYEWVSVTSLLMVISSLLLLVAAVIVELKSPEPIIPLGMFRNRTFTLSVIASISVGVSMFGTSVFLAQYMQLARGASPTESGLLTIPMMAGLLISSTVFGGLISRRGKWKAIMVSGAVLTVVGSILLGTLDYETNLILVGVYMAVLGAGIGMLMQNLVLVVQNSIDVRNLGVATSAITFFRSLGGTIGVSVLGSILGTVVAQSIKDDIAALKPADQALAGTYLGSGTIPQISELPDVLKTIVESAYGSGVGLVFLCAVPLTIVTLIAVAFLPNKPLGTLNAVQLKTQRGGDKARERDDANDMLIDVSTASVALPAVGLAHPTGSTPTVGSRENAHETQPQESDR